MSPLVIGTMPRIRVTGTAAARFAAPHHATLKSARTEVVHGVDGRSGDALARLHKRRGRPGLNTCYRKITKRRSDIEWTIDQEHIAYDHKSDGMYPLITNDRAMSPAQVLEAHKGQPMIEKRLEQIKTVHEIAPVFLKNEGRIEALITLYFLGLLVPAIME